MIAVSSRRRSGMPWLDVRRRRRASRSSVADRVEVVQDVGRLGDVDRDDERAVVAGAEALGDQVVGLARASSPSGCCAAVGQVEVEAAAPGWRACRGCRRRATTATTGAFMHERSPSAGPWWASASSACDGARAARRASPPSGRAAPGEAEQRRQQRRSATSDRDEHGDGGADAHDAEERDADDEQAEQRDDDGDAGEDDGAARGADRRGGRLLRLLARGQLRCGAATG